MSIRHLPARPDLRHLKLQARSLLKACLARQPEARSRIEGVCDDSMPTLAKAQTTIAREYGQRSWPRLIARVAALHYIHTPPRDRSASLTPALLDQIVELYPHYYSECETALERAGAAGVDALIKGLNHKSARVRACCAGYFDRHRDPRGIAALCLHVNDPVPRVRGSVIHSLGCEHCSGAPLEDEHVKFVQAACLNDASFKVRRGAAFLLGQQLNDASARQVLHTLLLREPEREVRDIARAGLSNHGRLRYGSKTEAAIREMLNAPVQVEEKVENGPPRMLYYELSKLTEIVEPASTRQYRIRLIIKAEKVASVNVVEFGATRALVPLVPLAAAVCSQ